VSSAGEFLARAAFSPSSQIRLRIWTFDEHEQVDAAFVHGRIACAIDARRRLGLLEPDTVCRLVFAESDGMPGLIVDRYADYLVCQFLAAGMEPWRDAVVGALLELLSPRGIFERSEAATRRKEGLGSRRGVLAGASPPPIVEAHSDGARLGIDIVHGQKTGAYLDQQRNRSSVARYACGARVLDAFSYSGAFALASLLHGGTEATLIDTSSDALRLAERAAEKNGVAQRCRYAEANVFEELRRLKDAARQFELVILDPPKFVHSADQIRSGSRGYKDINMLGLQLVAPGGIVATFSCSGHVDGALFQKIVAGAAVDAGRDVQILERLAQPPDHPVALAFPEAEYLKGLILRVY
jgi:23S rRNA (cytosine1962-C5)-methyltransferase